MDLAIKRLLGLRVRTKAGQALGKVSNATFDAETGRLRALEVKIHRFVPEMFDEHLLIAWSQIVEVTQKEVIVQDGVVPVGARGLVISSTP